MVSRARNQRAAAARRRRKEQDPVGFWDPAGFTSDDNVENLQRRRLTELKQGRVSMLATMGYYLSPSMDIKFADVQNSLAAISEVPSAGWTQILAYGAFCEFSQKQSPDTAASQGDFGFKVLTSSDPAEKQKKLSAELANGRLAIMAIVGMFFQDGLTGSARGDWALYTASPLRELVNELGVQDPVAEDYIPSVGFWDPVGYTADGSVENIQSELKHGKLSLSSGGSEEEDVDEDESEEEEEAVLTGEEDISEDEEETWDDVAPLIALQCTVCGNRFRGVPTCNCDHDIQRDPDGHIVGCSMKNLKMFQ